MKQLLAAVLAAVVLLCGCSGAAPGAAESEPLPGVGGSTRRPHVESTELQFETPAANATLAVLETDKGNITVVLFARQAPLAVENFCTLAQEGYYNGTTFHRTVADFVIQGGDATGNGLSGQSIWGGTFDTERSDALHHYSGALCMATGNGLPGSHLSQFYIVATPPGLSDDAVAKLQAVGYRQEVAEAYRVAGGAPYLDLGDTVFGQVVEGMDVVDEIARGRIDEETGRPRVPVAITRITVQNYPPAQQQPQLPPEPEPEPDSEPPAEGGDDADPAEGDAGGDAA